MAGTLLVVVIFYFLLDSLLSNYQKLSALQYTVEYPRMVLSFLLLFAVYLFNPWHGSRS